MSIFDTISMALRNLWKRKLRTFLTVLGVVIGTTSIVVMISIGIGMNESFQSQVEQWGSLQVINVSSPSGGNRGMMISSEKSNNANSAKNKKDVVLNSKAIEEFKAIPGVETATLLLTDYNIKLVCGKYVAEPEFKGIDPESMEAMGYNLAEGRFLNEEDKMAVVVGQDISQNFYNPKLSWQMRYNSERPQVNLLEEKSLLTYDYNYGTKNAEKKIKPYKIEVVGMMQGSGNDSYSVIMPIKQLEKIIDEREKYEKSQQSGRNTGNTNSRKKGVYEQAMVKVKNMEQVQEVQQVIKDMGYEAYSLSDYLESMKETSKMLRMMLSAIGAISLIVAAIGITNTMVMSIYERTREIGVMKVIGASLFDIKKLFLTEAAFIGFAGGLFGVALSLLASKLVNVIAQQQQSDMLSSVPVWLCLASLGFATFIGIAAGYFPAQRAMKLSALSAIKTE